MILTCPSCGTQYEVKDGAIPPQGRQVRCASCKHSWHQDPMSDQASQPDSPGIPAEAVIEPRDPVAAEERAYEAAALAAASDGDTLAGPDELADPPGDYDAAAPDMAAAEFNRGPGGDFGEEDSLEAVPAAYEPAETPVDDGGDRDEFSPFAYDEEEPRRRRPLLSALLVALLIAAMAAAFWFLAPPSWKERVGIAGAADTPLQLMMTHSDRQKLASGNELLAVSGRVINPTESSQQVPPIQAQLRSRTGELVHSWTIAPPARTLPPGASATFNSAEVNVPAGGDELTITLGGARAS